jgi:hypothetical protein
MSDREVNRTASGWDFSGLSLDEAYGQLHEMFKPFAVMPDNHAFINAIAGTRIGFFHVDADPEKCFNEEQTYFIETVGESGVLEIPGKFCDTPGRLRIRRYDPDNRILPFAKCLEIPITSFKKGQTYNY